MIRKHVISAVFRRNFTGYFRSPIGYVFISVFILLAAIMAFWSDTFFVNNLCNLDVLNTWFPYLLLFFVPAVAMGTWAEERKQGTDELLLTLPASDLELVLGKYLSLVGIYAASLLFSFSYIMVLVYLGSPDYGLVIGTYLGYLFIGAALLSVAMVASLLTSSVTVAFILGALFVALPVFISSAGSVVPGKKAGWLESLGVDDPFRSFTSGVVSLQSIVYFVSMAVLFLYVNWALLARRRGGVRISEGPVPVGTGQIARLLGVHFSVRSLCILVMAISLGALTDRLGARIDVTQERLHSLAPATREIISRITAERPVYIQAYVSPEVPTEFVELRQTLVSLLRDIAAMGGARVQLRIVDTERHSAESREADERFGIKARPVRMNDEGQVGSEEIFLGVACTCGGEEVVLPFLERGVPVEYELTRSIGTVIGAKRRRVGVATTDAKMFGSFDMQTMRPAAEWEILAELRKQYDVQQVALDSPITEKFDCLIVGMPSSLTQMQQDILSAYLRAGNPALLMDDPFPAFNAGLSPDQPKAPPGGNRNPFGPPPGGEPKGDMYRFVDGLGFRWSPETFVGENWNPHRQYPQLPKEYVFVGPGSGNPEAFNTKSSISSKLQEIFFLFPGHIEKRPELTDVVFTPLAQTSRQSATLQRFQVMQQSFMGAQINPRRLYVPGGRELTLAARIEGTMPAQPAMPGQPPGPKESAKLKFVFVADLDFVSNAFFDLRREGIKGLSFDNVTFVLNCVDSLAGDETIVELRKRRPRHRTLTAVENLTEAHVKKEAEESKAAEDSAKKELDDARRRLTDAAENIKKRTDLDPKTKETMILEVEEVEKRVFEQKEKEINDKKESAIERSTTERDQAIKGIRKKIKILAVLLPPIPAILVALLLFVQRASQPRRAA